MVKIELPKDFAEHIGSALGWKMNVVSEAFEFEEDKQGFFVAALKTGCSLSVTDFKTVCRLARDLGGQYVQGKRRWRVPGPYAKKSEALVGSQPESVAQSTRSTGVTPHLVSMDKSGLPILIKPGYYEKFPVASILSPKFALRLNIEGEIHELMEQIATTKASGEWCYIVQPLICRPATKPGYTEVCAGERRLLAARKLGLKVIPVVVKELSNEEFDRIRLMENVARKDLTDHETARAIKHLMDTYPNIYPTQAEIAEVFGKSVGWVSRHLAILKLAEFAPGQIEVGKLTERQAREILAAPKEKREEILEKIAESGEVPSSREIRRAVQPEIEPEPTTAGPPELKPLEAPEPKPEEIDTGFEWECPECHQRFQLIHVSYPDGKIKHKLEAKG